MPLTLVSPGGNGVGKAVLLLPILLPDSSSRSHVMITCQTECGFRFTMVASADNKTAPSVPSQSGYEQFIGESIRIRRLCSVCGHDRVGTQTRCRT